MEEKSAEGSLKTADFREVWAESVIICATRFSYKYPRFAGSLSDKSFA